MKSIACSVLLLLLGLGSVTAEGIKAARNPSVSQSKKGVGLTPRSKDWAARVDALNVSWHYSWGPALRPEEPQGVEFVPMIWGYQKKDAKFLEHLEMVTDKKKQGAVRSLLGFNEPDVANQAKMTVQQALEAWPHLQKTGLRLGSPATTHGDVQWMQSFMRQAREKNYRVDFVCVHWYGGPNPDSLIKELRKVHSLYGKPIWITEFAVADWKAKTIEDNPHSPEEVLRFMREVLPKLDELSFVERYAWFPSNEKNVHTSPSALFQNDGSLTKLGRFYAAHQAGKGRK